MATKKTKVADNLYIYETAKGSRSWVFRGTVDGKRIERGLGSEKSLTLKEAKRAAAAVLLETPKAERMKEETFGSVYEDAIADIARLKQWKRGDTEREWCAQIAAYALPVLKDKPVSRITRDDVLAVLKPMWMTKPMSASALRLRLEAILDWGLVHGYRDGMNPASWRGNLALFLPVLSRVHEIKHREAPTLEELRNAVKLCLADPDDASRALLWIISTACRSNEACLMESREVEGRVWTIDPAHQKTKIYQRIPLSQLAMKAWTDRDGRQFEDASDAAVLRRLKRICRRPEGEPSVTVHGIRSTFRDWCADNGVNDAVAERCLSHKWGSTVTQAYYRNDLLDQRRAVMQKWADALTH